MELRIINRIIIFGTLLLCPSISFCKVSDFSSIISKYDLGFLLIAGFSAVIIVAAIISIFNLSLGLLSVQKDHYGVDQKQPKKRPFWELTKDRLSDIVPIEKEKSILLNHDYDGIQELDNNLPPWWLYGFYISIIFGVFYLGYFHYFEYGENSTIEYEQEVLRAEIAVSKYLEGQANSIDESNLEALVDQESLSQGLAIFRNNCIACHLEGGGGSPVSVGPNLTDEYWIHKGGIRDIFKTIKYGVPDKGMIAWKAQLKPADMHRVASYILSLQGTNPPNAKKPEGELYVSSETQEEDNKN